MSLCVCGGAVLKCPFGSLPAVLAPSPEAGVLAGGFPAGVLTDAAPVVNVPPLGLCKSLSNPTVASATTAAMGTLTPMPCVPVPVGSWTDPASDVLIGGHPALTDASKLPCAWGGEISIQFAGQTSVRL